MRAWNCTMTVALALTVAACATQPPQPAATKPAATTLAATTPAAARGFDGTYSGDAVADQVTEACGAASQPIEIKVIGSHIYTRHSHPSLDGTIDTSGEVTMQNDDGSSSLTGSIQGNALSATETTTRAPRKLEGFFANATSTCTLAVQATRASGGDADGAP